MSTLKLYGMRAAYDEVMTTGIKRRHEPSSILSDLLNAQIGEKRARSIKYHRLRLGTLSGFKSESAQTIARPGLSPC
jgi:hypothetical protein